LTEIAGAMGWAPGPRALHRFRRRARAQRCRWRLLRCPFFARFERPRHALEGSVPSSRPVRPHGEPAHNLVPRRPKSSPPEAAMVDGSRLRAARRLGPDRETSDDQVRPLDSPHRS
jgi:hypothetical protein